MDKDVGRHTVRAPAELLELIPTPPRWVHLLFDDACATPPSRVLQVARSGGWAYFSILIHDARSLSAPALRDRVCEAYVAVGDAVSSLQYHAVRFWNFVPAPGDLMAPGLDRYMVFNTGRYDAFARWYGTARPFNHRFATASAVGIGGSDLTVLCLAAETPGTPVENPRQTPAWSYSPRYGPKPPCFARATVVTLGGKRRVLIGGTASIVGEDSRHVGDPEAQVDETLTNLRALIAAARGAAAPATDEIARLTDVRVYVKRSRDAMLVRSMIEAQCRGVTALEMWSSQVCRQELLVEIEGVATV